jgi:hypothetical protein
VLVGKIRYFNIIFMRGKQYSGINKQEHSFHMLMLNAYRCNMHCSYSGEKQSVYKFRPCGIWHLLFSYTTQIMKPSHLQQQIICQPSAKQMQKERH